MISDEPSSESSATTTAGFVDVFNVLDANPEQNTNWSCAPSFLRPLSVVPPRLARIGLNLEW